MDLALTRSPWLPAGVKSRIVQVLECRVPPLAQVLVVAGVMWGLARSVPAAQLDIPNWLAVLFALSGAAVSLSGVWEFRKARTTVDPRAPVKTGSLVVCGVYRFSRNPMYLGFLLVLLGWGMYLGSFLSIAMLPLFIAYMHRFQILPEERQMLEKFGAEFEAYSRRARRWI